MWKITHIGQRRTRKTKRKIPNITTVSKGEDNLTLLRRYCGKLHIVFLPQALNFEDELVRYTDVKNAAELTQSRSIRNFKTDFCKSKAKDCRAMLERHRLNTKQLWTTKVPEIFSFAAGNSDQIKVK